MDIPSLGAGIVGLSFLGDLLIAAAQEINTNKLMTEQSKVDAKLAFSEALFATEKYYALRAEGKSKNLEMEYDIALLWNKISILIEPFNKDLAQRLNIKSRFWQEGAIWSDEQIKDAKIELTRVRRDSSITFLKK